VNGDRLMNDVLTLPIDQYQRYRMAAQIAEALRIGGSAFRALEVGGYPPRLQEFLRSDAVLVTDRMPHNAPGYMQADALALPFPDNSFDLVVSLDVLEHIPQSDRPDFIESLKSVAAQYLIIAAPFDDPGGRIKEAESLLLDFINERHGYEHEFFKEHLDHGLPQLDKTLKIFSMDGWETLALPNGYFLRWFWMTLMDYALQNRAEATREKLRRFYNINYYPLDNREPAYRRFIVASQSGFSDAQRKNLEGLKSEGGFEEWPPMDYIRTSVELARLDAQDALTAQLDGLKHDLAARDEEIKHLKQHIKELTQFIDKIKNFLPYRIYSKLFK